MCQHARALPPGEHPWPRWAGTFLGVGPEAWGAHVAGLGLSPAPGGQGRMLGPTPSESTVRIDSLQSARPGKPRPPPQAALPRTYGQVPRGPSQELRARTSLETCRVSPELHPTLDLAPWGLVLQFCHLSGTVKGMPGPPYGEGASLGWSGVQVTLPAYFWKWTPTPFSLKIPRDRPKRARAGMVGR